MCVGGGNVLLIAFTKGIVDENFAISKQNLFHWLTHKHCLLSCEIRNACNSLANDVCKSSWHSLSKLHVEKNPLQGGRLKRDERQQVVDMVETGPGDSILVNCAHTRDQCHNNTGKVDDQHRPV